MASCPRRQPLSENLVGGVRLKTSAGIVSTAPAAYVAHWKRAGGACQYTGPLFCLTTTCTDAPCQDRPATASREVSMTATAIVETVHGPTRTGSPLFDRL